MPRRNTKARAELLKLRDEVKNAGIPQLVARIDKKRSALARLLRSYDAKVLAKRPPSGEWSIIENVRHLLFAEQIHFGRFLPGKVQRSRVGLSGRTGRAYADVGTEPSTHLDEVLREWNAVHRPIRKAMLGGDEEVRHQLTGNLLHLQQHISVIEEILEGTGPSR
jgi:hypothetical protein